MAFLNNAEDEEQTNPNAGQPKTTGASSGMLGDGGAPTAGGANPKAQAASTPGSGPQSNFVGIQQYIDANKSGTQKLANDLSSDANKMATNADLSIQRTAQDFGKQNNANNYNNGFANSSYSGPDSYAGYSGFQPMKSLVDATIQRGNDLTSETGQRQLLSDQQKSRYGDVNQGALTLDSALVNTDPYARGVLNSTKRDIQDKTNNQFNKYSNSVATQIANTKDAVKTRADQLAIQQQEAAAQAARQKTMDEAEAAKKAAAQKAYDNEQNRKKQLRNAAKSSTPTTLAGNVPTTPQPTATVLDQNGKQTGAVNPVYANAPVNVDSSGREVKSSKFTFVCTELLRRKLITKAEFSEIHKMQMKSWPRRARFGAWYIDNGQRLVDLANAQGFDWSLAKEWFFDAVLCWDKQQSREHWYGIACGKLCEAVAPELWDARVMRNSYIDSVVFLPKVISYAPHRRMILKELKNKFALVEVTHGQLV